MAFGQVRGTLAGTGLSVLNPSVASGSVVIVVGDLIIAVMSEQTALTVTAVTDNLGNVYTAQNAGTDAGAVSGRMFWSRVSAPGTLTAVNFAATASADNFSVGAVVYEGPFRAGPSTIDKSALANISNDTTTPYNCTATGTLTQAFELLVAWVAKDGNAVWVAAAPGLVNLSQADAGSLASLAIQSQVVNVTTTVTQGFTGTASTTDVLGAATFMQDNLLIGQAML